MRYRVALEGFRGEERRALAEILDDPRARDPAYECVDSLALADLVVANGDSEGVIYTLEQRERVGVTAFIGLLAPSGALAHLKRPVDPAQVRRSLDRLVARAGFEPGAFAKSLGLAGVVRTAPHDAPAALPGARSNAKTAARRAVRRAQFAATAPAPNSPSVPANVLVLDPSETGREQLCRLLEVFGFCTYPVSSLAQAAWMTQTRELEAA